MTVNVSELVGHKEFFWPVLCGFWINSGVRYALLQPYIGG